MTSGGREIKNKEEILRVLAALMLPKEIAIVHCPGHQKEEEQWQREIDWRNEASKTAAENSEQLPPILSLEELALAAMGLQEQRKKEEVKPDKKLRTLHHLTHLGI